MDFLSHLFVPLIAVYVLRRDLFDSPWLLGLGGLGLLSDFDKFLRMPGVLHSLVTIVPICAAILAVEYGLRGELRYAPVVVCLVGSHLVLDFLDGGPVPLLYPFVETGLGLQYPAQTVFGGGLFGLRIDGPLVALRTASPRPGNNTYGFVQGPGVASMLLFAVIYVGDRWQHWRSTVTRNPGSNAGPGDESNRTTDRSANDGLDR